MNRTIELKPQDACLRGYLRFALTKKAYGRMMENTENAQRFLTRFTAGKLLMLTEGKNQGLYEVYTANGMLLCRVSDDNNSLLVVDFQKNTLMKQNNAMKNGVSFRVDQGIIVSLTLTAPYNMYFDICNGKAYADKAFSATNVSAALQIISRTMAEARKKQDRPPVEEEEAYQPELRLANLLQLSESYSILSSQLEESKAQALGNVPYLGIHAAEYDRIDRVAYQFDVAGLDESVFKAGVQVEVEDKDGEKHNAEVISLLRPDPDSPATGIVLLFNGQIDITKFHSSGWFGLSFSTVNKDVQLAANEKLRAGEAEAKYMDAVLGRNMPKGFENKDLRQLRERLNASDRPPNQSQMDAICRGINSKDVFLVMGPPGTGKTTVILEWVKYFVTQEHKRVLVSSQNNMAVDNVLARLSQEKDIDVIRIGSESKIQSELVPFMFENKVAALRKNIVDNSVSVLEQVDFILSQWSDYSTRLDAWIVCMNEVERERQLFQQVAQKEILPAYQELTDLIRSHTSVCKDTETALRKVRKYDHKVTRHEHAKNPIFRFFTGLFYKYNQRKAREFSAHHDSLRNRQFAIAQEYSRKKRVYEKTLDRIRSVDFMVLYTVLEKCNSAYSAVSIQPDTKDADMWGLFREVEGITLQEDSRKARQMVEAIEQARTKAAALKEVVSDWNQEMASKQNYALNEIVMESVDLVGATCIGINSQKRFANLDFDVTIIDEAGQIQIHNALVPMSVSNKLIMLGDHKQIPPTADKELLELCEDNGVSTELLEKSLFEKMYHDLPAANKMMLDTQYRMPGQIADTISEWFYDGAYYSPDFKRGMKSRLPWLSGHPFVIVDTSGAPGRQETKIEGAGSNNAMEARIVTEIVRAYAADAENDLKEIGVISAYKSQVKLIRGKLSGFLPREMAQEMVATLDSYQGQEREIILYSFTKSSGISPENRRIGFLNELRRLNVAMTRCKKMLVLIGDMEFLGGCRHCDEDEDGDPVYDKSEKQFSDFINKMLADVANGRGERISYQEFLTRMKGRED